MKRLWPGRTIRSRCDLQGYAICTEPRSGSNFLCEVLASTGMLGKPTEYFSGATRRRRGMANYPDDREAQVEKILDLAMTPNGVYGLKIFEFQIDQVRHTRWTERLPSLGYIHLIRLDVLGQAISLVRALQTSQWIADDLPEAGYAYDFNQIRDQLVRIQKAQNRWASYIRRQGAPILRLVYEDIARAPQSAATAVAEFLGLDEEPIVDMAQVGLRVQRDAVTEEWRRRFIAAAGDLPVCRLSARSSSAWSYSCSVAGREGSP